MGPSSAVGKDKMITYLIGVTVAAFKLQTIAHLLPVPFGDIYLYFTNKSMRANDCAIMSNAAGVAFLFYQEGPLTFVIMNGHIYVPAIAICIDASQRPDYIAVSHTAAA